MNKSVVVALAGNEPENAFLLAGVAAGDAMPSQPGDRLPGTVRPRRRSAALRSARGSCGMRYYATVGTSGI